MTHQQHPENQPAPDYVVSVTELGPLTDEDLRAQELADWLDRWAPTAAATDEDLCVCEIAWTGMDPACRACAAPDAEEVRAEMLALELGQVAEWLEDLRELGLERLQRGQHFGPMARSASQALHLAYELGSCVGLFYSDEAELSAPRDYRLVLDELDEELRLMTSFCPGGHSTSYGYLLQLTDSLRRIRAWMTR